MPRAASRTISPVRSAVARRVGPPSAACSRLARPQPTVDLMLAWAAAAPLPLSWWRGGARVGKHVHASHLPQLSGHWKALHRGGSCAHIVVRRPAWHALQGASLAGGGLAAGVAAAGARGVAG